MIPKLKEKLNEILFINLFSISTNIPLSEYEIDFNYISTQIDKSEYISVFYFENSH